MICCFPRGRETERERSCFPLKHVKIDTRLEMSTRAIFIRGTFSFRPGRVSASTASAEDVHGSDSPGAPAKPLKKTWSFFKLGAWQGSSRLRSSSLKGGIPPWAKACSFYGVLQCLFPSSGSARLLPSSAYISPTTSTVLQTRLALRISCAGQVTLLGSLHIRQHEASGSSSTRIPWEDFRPAEGHPSVDPLWLYHASLLRLVLKCSESRPRLSAAAA